MEFDISKEQLALTPIFAPIAKILALILPISEIIVALLLFFHRTRKIGLIASLTLMLLFTGYIIYILKYNTILPCSCGGVIELLSWKQHLILNFSLIILLLTSILLHGKYFSVSRSSQKSAQNQIA
jgi:hypothetical protein